MADERPIPGAPEPDTESVEELEEEVPTEDQEPPAGDTQDSELATVEVLAQEIEDLRARAAQRDDFLDRLQRLKADFANYQKRQERERERWAEDARRSLALAILPAVDDLELALGAGQPPAGAEPAGGALRQGIELIHGKLLAALAAQGIVPFEAQGKPYDPAYHEAIALIEKPDAPDRSIIEVVRKGYLIGDKVLRPARVVVSKQR